jgi:uncharacterized phiE125 gp8 family phage protein
MFNTYKIDKRPILNLVTGPATEVVDLANDAYAQTFLRVNSTKYTDLYNLCLNQLNPAARNLCEKYTNRKFFTQTWKMMFDWQPEEISFPFGQLQSVTSIKTYADDNSTTLEAAGNYTIVTGDYGLVYLESGNTWTSTTRNRRIFEIIFVCGWTAVASVPRAIYTAILQTIAFLLENRESLPRIGDAEEGTQLIPSPAKLLLDSYELFPMV